MLLNSTCNKTHKKKTVSSAKSSASPVSNPLRRRRSLQVEFKVQVNESVLLKTKINGCNQIFELGLGELCGARSAFNL